ncbi:glutathione-disulfide reductase [Benzoatithermus flavus]|uniref:Glutathione-disulfide reductase n=1 Tax=Benzoatithermus flavus TaxID=3108223 RepID=A0ABU8XLN9_9PROT
MTTFDLFIIGAGSGGVACARRAASYGAKVGIAEARRVGGTCVIRGCVPKKLMHYGAHFGEALADARAYGWQIGERPPLDFEALCRARNQEIDRLNGIYIDMLKKAGVELFTGRARVQPRWSGDGFVVAVGEHEIHTRRILVAVGAHPSLPEIDGIEHAMTSDEVLEQVYPLPRRLVVVGAGYIGVEFASIFRALGADTTLVLRGDLPLRGFEEDLRRHLTDEMRAHGLKIQPDTRVERIERTSDGFALHTNRGVIACDRVIYATGRAPIPNTRGIGLEDLGVRMSDIGVIQVDRGYASNVKGIFAVGDCSDHGGHGLGAAQFDLTPVAIAEGRALAEAQFNDNPQTVAYETIPTAVFALPQASSVGLSEARARSLGYDVTIYRTRFRPMVHTLTGGSGRTMMKLVVDKASDRVLGCHMVGEDAAEIIQGFAVALTAGATKAVFDATVALHPTAAEEFVTMYQPAQS